jgi:alkaline phosphatase
LIELAKIQGKLTGIVVTSSIVHATPAAFIAHQRLRGFYEAIADNLVKQQVDYFVGGGRMYFTNRYSDDRDLVEELKGLDYTVGGYDRKSFRTFSNKLHRRMAYFTSHAEPLPYMQGRERLAEVVDHALRMLSSQGDKGFFLMIEASQIDYASHSNDNGYLLSEMQDMDGAVKIALEYAKLHEDTLVIVTADHECGDLVFLETKPDRKANIKFLSRNHTATMVPVFAIGPGSQLFSGIYENTEIFHKIRSVAGY